MRLIPLIGAVAFGALLILVGAFGARWLGQPAAPANAAVELVPATAPAADADFHARIDLAAVRELLAVLPAAQRERIVGDATGFEKFVQQETVNQAVLAAAYANGAEHNEAIRTLMQRAGQRVLVEAYLNQVVQGNLDPGFPTDEQVREAYDKNPDAFKLPRRMHLWQIFLPLDDSADDAQRKKTWALAEGIVRDLRSGKATFGAMAKKYSAHQQSRVNDGYMGVIKVDELLPPVAEAAAGLKENDVSDPIATAGGLHIIRRGAVLEEQLIDFDTVKAQVRERLKREAALKVRQAAIEKIVQEFPVENAGQDVAAWRKSLLGSSAGD